MNSEIADLLPSTQTKANLFIDICTDRNIDILIYGTFRTLERQARLFRRGRFLSVIMKKNDELREEYSRPDLADILLSVGPQFEKKIVTHAGPGQSIHNYRQAFDFVPMRDAKPVWGTQDMDDYMLWKLAGESAVDAGFVWGGNFVNFKDFPHVQEPNANWRQLIKENCCE